MDIDFNTSKKFCDQVEKEWKRKNKSPSITVWNTSRHWERMIEYQQKLQLHIETEYYKWLNSNGYVITGVDEKTNDLIVKRIGLEK